MVPEFVNSTNMDNWTFDERQQTAIDDLSEDCEVVSVNWKRKRKLKPETFEEEPKRNQLESSSSSQVEGDASNREIIKNVKTKFLKSDDSVSKSDDILTDVKCDCIKTDVISLDHNYVCLAINCKSVDVKVSSLRYLKSEPASSDAIDTEAPGCCVIDAVKCEPVISAACNSHAVTSVKSESKAPANVTPSCCTLSETEPDVPSLDSKASVGDEKPNSSPFLYDVCENVSLDYKSLAGHKQEKPSLEVDIIEKQVCNYPEDESYCETNLESNVLSIEPILEEETLALDVGNPVLDVGCPVLDVRSPVLDVGNPALDVGSPALDVESPTNFPHPKTYVPSTEPILQDEIPTTSQVVPTGLLLHDRIANAVRDDFVTSQKAVDSQKSNKFPQERFGEFYKCGKCAGLFKTLEDSMDHENSRSRCNSSSRRLYKVVVSADKLSNSKKTHVCECCNKQFTCALELDDHYATAVATHCEGGVSFSCNVCGKKFAVDSHLMHHRRVRGHGSLMYVCKICHESFQDSSLIENHLKTAHKRTDGNNMKQHITRVPVITVDVLSKGDEAKLSMISTNMESRMESHEDKVSSKSMPRYTRVSSSVSKPFTDLKLFICDICQQGFQHKENLLKHSGIHSQDKVQTCMICEKTFDEIESLKSHMSVHQRSTYRWQKYHLPLYISNHVKINAGSDFPYVCSLCGMIFASLNLARAHLTRHGYCNYACNICGEEKTTKGVCKRRCGVSERNLSNSKEQSFTMVI